MCACVRVCPPGLARMSRTMLKGSGERGRPRRAPDHSGKASGFSPVSVMLAVGLGVDILY